MRERLLITLSVTVGSPEKSSPSFSSIRFMGGNNTRISRKASASVTTYAYDAESTCAASLKCNICQSCA